MIMRHHARQAQFVILTHSLLGLGLQGGQHDADMFCLSVAAASIAERSNPDLAVTPPPRVYIRTSKYAAIPTTTNMRGRRCYNFTRLRHALLPIIQGSALRWRGHQSIVTGSQLQWHATCRWHARHVQAHPLRALTALPTSSWLPIRNSPPDVGPSHSGVRTTTSPHLACPQYIQQISAIPAPTPWCGQLGSNVYGYGGARVCGTGKGHDESSMCDHTPVTILKLVEAQHRLDVGKY